MTSLENSEKKGDTIEFIRINGDRIFQLDLRISRFLGNFSHYLIATMDTRLSKGGVALSFRSARFQFWKKRYRFAFRRMGV